MTTTALFVHVPVDKIEICKGPRACRWIDAIMITRRRQFNVDPDIYAEVEFTLKTAASKMSFKRKIKLALIDTSNKHSRDYYFAAIFNGQVVSGYYNPDTQTGWFNLD